MLLVLNEPMAIACGVSVPAQRTIFIVLLSLVVGSSIPAIGALLVSAFVAIPACTARLLGRGFNSYVVLSAIIGALSAAVGMPLSAYFDLQSGPSIVLTQTAIFIVAIIFSRTKAIAS